MFDLKARLLHGVNVPPGFEMVLAGSGTHVKPTPRVEVECRNLWYNTNLSDDPTQWDDEIQRLNHLQITLPPLSDEQRLVRAQIAELCREHPLFPGSVDVLLMNIGEGDPVEPSRLGCEGRGLLKLLGVYDEHSVEEQTQRTVQSLSDALTLLQEGEEPDDPRTKRLASLHALVDDQSVVEWLASEVSEGVTEPLGFKERCRAKMGADTEDYDGRPFTCTRCEGAAECCIMKQAEALLLSHSSDVDRGRRALHSFTMEYVLAYSDAVNSWLTGNPPFNPWNTMNGLYVDEDEAARIIDATHILLGEKTQVKVWLTGCLLKTLKSNQRWHGRLELLDGFPGAVSWLK